MTKSPPVRTMHIGSRLRTLMHSAGITAHDVAGLYGVTVSAVESWQRGCHMPTKIQWQLAALLGVSVDEMLGEWE